MPEFDDLQPGGEAPAEGAREPDEHAPDDAPDDAGEGDHPEESHLGEPGDPAEG